MSKRLFAAGVSVLAIGSFAALSGGSLPGASSAATPIPGVVPNPDESPSRQQRLGVRLGPVSEALAAHLDLPTGSGLLVQSVGDDAPEGLEQHDVIVLVNREAADLATLDRAMARGKGLSLLVMRAGVQHRVVVEAASLPSVRLASAAQGDPVGFLSTDSLEADHPFHRLVAYRALEQEYAAKADAFHERRREAEARSRELREEVREGARVLQQRCEAEIEAYTAAREKEVLELLDRRLAVGILEPLAGLRIELDEVLPPEGAEAIDAAWAKVDAGLAGGLEEQVVFEPDDEERARRARSQLIGVTREARKLVGERCGAVWQSSLQDIRQHGPRLAPRHDEQVRWVTNALEVTRAELRERVSCAFRRTREEFSKQLGRRLANMEVPVPGEVEACMEDVRRQVDRMARRFIERTEGALARFEGQVASANTDLRAAAAEGLPRCEAAMAQLQRGVDAVRADWFDGPRRIDETWQSREDLRDLACGLRAALARLADEGRAAVRGGCVPLQQAFREHRVVCDDAWRDLRQYLGELQREAASDCWKIDGPHLDGRFPGVVPEGPEESQELVGKPRGEVTMLTE